MRAVLKFQLETQYVQFLKVKCIQFEARHINEYLIKLKCAQICTFTLPKVNSLRETYIYIYIYVTIRY